MHHRRRYLAFLLYFCVREEERYAWAYTWTCMDVHLQYWLHIMMMHGMHPQLWRGQEQTTSNTGWMDADSSGSTLQRSISSAVLFHHHRTPAAALPFQLQAFGSPQLLLSEHRPAHTAQRERERERGDHPRRE
jgi:hypothetical protein